jgi:RHS repeat-associated protein
VIDHDANGNRKSVTIGATTRVYGTEVVAGTTTPKSNRLKTLSNPAVSLTHQAIGQTLSNASGASYSYYRNGSIRLIMLPGRTQSVGFMYDANGQRLRKYTQNQVGGVWVVDEASQIHFVYDQAGHLLGEYDKSGTALREYIWLDDTPVALFTPGATATAAPIFYYIHTDHLNTPRAVLNTAGQLRWRWIADPFGTAVPETNPAGLGAFTQNLRMPGQYADSETGLFYNMARYYDPMIGRYVESDPIGLGGGINTYAYVMGNPLSYVDPNGLETNVTVWQPVGWGSSSFGHVSTDINGTTYSWGPGGMSVLPTANYLAKNGFRDGMGLGIPLTPQQEEAIKACLSKPRGDYSVTSNNCGTPIQDCLKQVGIDTGNQTLPVSLGNRLLDMGRVNGIKDYPASRPGNGRSAPWAR